ncbi:5'-nucleotidase /3'-nucleotidase /exopolyphosphatase [Kribbella sp. VKM Ac-2569]|uniref:5'/3'-nucleotidase SurE n=1 Tax=Kribbella sp. VKM Ac-2569 TaxID=2512220 RepID=UPI00102C3813|nr:5'/3'-nucleotidase SurE [Kribbella sp. VKM Ac-2569]RZT26401.1 5'-nucleotidase /3'-nucleotidase /exopolyphosphatase [Kribbella sp. VKM Ac-2569]
MPSEPLRVLITNDDGYRAPGIRALAPAIAELGYDVLVVAPMIDESGVGSARAGIVDRPIRTASDVENGVTFVGIEGTPAVAVTLAQAGAFGPPPDLVLSGINRGMNIGVSIFHSGTVAAALTAAETGTSAVAVSLDADAPEHWATAATIAGEALGWVAGEPAGTVLTINVPDRPLDQLAGVRHASLAVNRRTRLVATTAPSGEPMIALERYPQAATVPGTDEALLSEGFVTVTPIVGIREVRDDAAATALAKRLMQ